MSDLEDSDTGSMGEEEILEDPNSEQHEKEIQLLQQKDPEFYQYLKDFDKDLLDFKDEGQDSDDEGGSEMEEDSQSEPSEKDEPKPVAKPITTAMVDAWIDEIKSKSQNLRAIRSLLRAFRSACHYGDDAGNSNQNSSKLSIISSAVFNKIMVFVLNEMDGILRTLLNAPGTGGKKEMVSELMLTKNWKQYGSFMRVYLGNAYHILNQMTDEQMISFTIKRVRASAVFLAAFPSLLRKYIKVILHTWGTGRGILTVVSFLFLRDLCVRLGSDCLDTCLRGVYKAYIMNCKLSKSINAAKLQHIQFLGNCVIELCGVDPPAAYQLAFLFIRQLATVLRGALTEKGGKSVNDKKKGRKERENKPSKKQVEKAYQRVYDWQYILCLELWTGVICAYGSDTDFKPLAYPLAQIIQGVANLVPTVRYFPLRLRCVRMLNRIATATGTFVPVTSLLLDMLEMKELKGAPAGGIGTAVNLLSIKHVDKNTVKTRAFQEACIYSVVDELAEHLAQWSYSVAFFELSFIPVLRLRSFVKLLKAERFRKEIKELIHQAEVNIEFTNAKRIGIGFSPNDPAVESFLQVEKEKGESPLSIFVKNLRERSQLRRDSLVEKSVIIGAESASLGRKFKNEDDDDDDDEIDEEEAEAAFSSSWLPDKKKSKVEKEEEKKSKKKKRSAEEREDEDREDDIVEDLVLSSDEEEEEKDESDDGDEEMDFLSDDELEGTQRKRTFKGKRDFNKQKGVGKNKKKSKFKGGNKRARV